MMLFGGGCWCLLMVVIGVVMIFTECLCIKDGIWCYLIAVFVVLSGECWCLVVAFAFC